MLSSLVMIAALSLGQCPHCGAGAATFYSTNTATGATGPSIGVQFSAAPSYAVTPFYLSQSYPVVQSYAPMVYAPPAMAPVLPVYPLFSGYDYRVRIRSHGWRR